MLHRSSPKAIPLPDFDLHCPLLSLPLAFGTRLDTIPSAQAYLVAPTAQSMQWQTRLAAGLRPRIGLAWSGRTGHERDRERSIGLRAFLPLLKTGAAIVSVQKEVRTEDAKLLRERGDIFHAGDALTDFADTAALVEALDLVITVDTAVAHLAGALAKPVWLLNLTTTVLALAARPQRQPLVSDASPVPAGRHLRMGGRDCARPYGGARVRCKPENMNFLG